MIEWWQALCLALIQGLTECLPISSSAHLLLPSLLLGWADQGLAFDVAVHVGTLLAVLAYYRGELRQLLRSLRLALEERRMNPGARELAQLALASLPVMLVGLLLNARMEALRSVPVLIASTVGFALLLGYADLRAARPGAAALSSLRAALLVGLAQALAIVPGTSRSGITITAGLLLGLGREAAARFAFLLSIPVIAGAGLLKGLELAAAPAPARWGLLAAATLVAAASAYGCIALFLRLVARLGMQPFVVYRLLLGGALFLLWWR